MKPLENDVAVFHYAEKTLPALMKLCDLVGRSPRCLQPFRGVNDLMEALFAEEGFRLYPTVRKTTLLYDPATDSFLKVLHPLKIKNRLFYALGDKSGSLYHCREDLASKGIKVPEVTAYGFFKKGRKPFFFMDRVAGESLYEILIKGNRALPVDFLSMVLKEVIKLHAAGYWLGDAHLAHLYVADGRVTGIIDIDSIRKNSPFMLRHLAKDLAGLNHPELPLTGDEKKILLTYYLDNIKIHNEKKFLGLLNHYTRRRWKE